jgi:hypothetical protein
MHHIVRGLFYALAFGQCSIAKVLALGANEDDLSVNLAREHVTVGLGWAPSKPIIQSRRTTGAQLDNHV